MITGSGARGDRIPRPSACLARSPPRGGVSCMVFLLLPLHPRPLPPDPRRRSRPHLRPAPAPARARPARAAPGDVFPSPPGSWRQSPSPAASPRPSPCAVGSRWGWRHSWRIAKRLAPQRRTTPAHLVSMCADAGRFGCVGDGRVRHPRRLPAWWRPRDRLPVPWHGRRSGGRGLGLPGCRIACVSRRGRPRASGAGSRGERARRMWGGRRRGTRLAGPERVEGVGRCSACATGARNASGRPGRGQAPGQPGDGLLERLPCGRRRTSCQTPRGRALTLRRRVGRGVHPRPLHEPPHQRRSVRVVPAAPRQVYHRDPIRPREPVRLPRAPAPAPPGRPSNHHEARRLRVFIPQAPGGCCGPSAASRTRPACPRPGGASCRAPAPRRRHRPGPASRPASAP